MADGLRLLIVSSPYYKEIAAELEHGATAALDQAGAQYDIVHVPGAFEIPSAISFAHAAAIGGQGQHYDGYISLGCVVRGETSHYDYVCGESARGIATLCLQHNIVITNGILTVDNQEQALVRARTVEKNKGGVVADAALEMIALKRQFGLTE